MKLVRDKIDKLPWDDEAAKRRLAVIDNATPRYRELLRMKLFEESGELAVASRANDRDAVLEEAADVYEVLLAIVAAHMLPLAIGEVRAEAQLKLRTRAEIKHFERGGFLEGRTWEESPG